MQSIKSEFPLFTFGILEDHFVFYGGYDKRIPYDVFITDFSLKIQSKLAPFPIKDYHSLYEFTGLVNNSGKSVYYTPIASSKIYEVTLNGLSEKFHITIDNNTWPENKIYELEAFDLAKAKLLDISFLASWYQLDKINNWLGLSYFQDKYIRNAYYSINQNKIYTWKNFDHDPFSYFIQSNHPIGVSEQSQGGIFYYIDKELLNSFAQSEPILVLNNYPIESKGLEILNNSHSDDKDFLIMKIVYKK